MVQRVFYIFGAKTRTSSIHPLTIIVIISKLQPLWKPLARSVMSRSPKRVGRRFLPCRKQWLAKSLIELDSKIVDKCAFYDTVIALQGEKISVSSLSFEIHDLDCLTKKSMTQVFGLWLYIQSLPQVGRRVVSDFQS